MYKKIMILACLIGSIVHAAAHHVPPGVGIQAPDIGDDQQVAAPVGVAGAEAYGPLSPAAGAGSYLLTVENRADYAVHYDITMGEELDVLINDQIPARTQAIYRVPSGDYTIFYHFPTSPNIIDRSDADGGAPAIVLQVANQDVLVQLRAAG